MIHSSDGIIRDMESRDIVQGRILKGGLWPLSWLVFIFTPTILFLLLYVGVRGANPASIHAHLKVVAICLVGMMGLRIIAALTLSPVPRASRIVRAGVTAIFLYGLVLYYITATIGLYSWSRIFTIELVSSYAGEAFFAILDSFYIPPFLFFLVLASCLGIVFAASLFLEKRLDPCAPFPKFISRLPMLLISTFLVLISGFGLLAFTGNPRGDVEEPFALTFYPGFFGDPLQSLSMNHALANRYDAEAEVAKSQYRVPHDQGAYPTILLFVVDGLRPDHMAALGYHRDTTPFIEDAMSSGLVSRAGELHSVCADSSCGLLSLASSRYPHELSPGFFSLYEVLSLAGYRTSFMLGGDHRGFYGLADLYGDVDSLVDGSQFRDVGVNDDAAVLKMLESVPEYSGTPAFFQFHLMSAHNLGTRWDDIEKFKPAKNYGFRLLRGSRQESINFYDNGVRQTDRVIEKIMQQLQEKGYLDRYIAIITSDHGEALGEHGYWSHSRHVIEPMLKIPFIEITNERLGERTASVQPVKFGSIVDIAPTILELVGLPKPETWSGRSLLREPQPRTIFFRQGERAGLIESFEDGSVLKYWRNTTTGDEFVFDLESDPSESENVLRSVPKAVLANWRIQILTTLALVDSRTTD